VRGRKSPSPIDLAHGLYNSLYYRTSRDSTWTTRSVLTHFVDFYFYINFTLRQWTGGVERAHMIFYCDDWGRAAGGQGTGDSCPPATPLAPLMQAVEFVIFICLVGGITGWRWRNPRWKPLVARTSRVLWRAG